MSNWIFCDEKISSLKMAEEYRGEHKIPIITINNDLSGEEIPANEVYMIKQTMQEYQDLLGTGLIIASAAVFKQLQPTNMEHLLAIV